MPIDNNFSTRFARVFSDSNMTQSDFAAKIGVSDTMIKRYLKGEAKPGLDNIVEIARQTKVAIEWLVTGEGPMMKDVHSSYENDYIDLNSNLSLVKEKQPSYTHDVVVATQDLSDNSSIPMINYKAAANYVTGYQSQEYFENLSGTTLPKTMARGGQYYGLQVTGDSMYPTINNNDWLICRLIDRGDWQNIRNNYIHVVVSETRGINTKRILNRLKERGHLWCKSDNRAHAPFEIVYEDIIQVWQVEWRWTNYLPDLNDTLYGKVIQLEEDMREMKDAFLRRLNEESNDKG